MLITKQKIDGNVNLRLKTLEQNDFCFVYNEFYLNEV